MAPSESSSISGRGLSSTIVRKTSSRASACAGEDSSACAGEDSSACAGEASPARAGEALRSPPASASRAARSGRRSSGSPATTASRPSRSCTTRSVGAPPGSQIASASTRSGGSKSAISLTASVAMDTACVSISPSLGSEADSVPGAEFISSTGREDAARCTSVPFRYCPCAGTPTVDPGALLVNVPKWTGSRGLVVARRCGGPYRRRAASPPLRSPRRANEPRAYA